MRAARDKLLPEVINISCHLPIYRWISSQTYDIIKKNGMMSIEIMSFEFYSDIGIGVSEISQAKARGLDNK